MSDLTGGSSTRQEFAMWTIDVGACTPIEISGPKLGIARAHLAYIGVGECGPLLELIDEYEAEGLTYISAYVAAPGVILQPDWAHLEEDCVPATTRYLEMGKQVRVWCV